MTIEEKAEEMIFNFFCGVRQEDYTHKETVRLMVKFATETTKELQENIKDLEWQLQEVAKDNDVYQKQNKELQKQLDGYDLEMGLHRCHERIEELEEVNKANEWHYVKDGDLPNTNTQNYTYIRRRKKHERQFTDYRVIKCFVLCLNESGKTTADIGYFDCNKKCFLDKAEGFIYAWKEIVLPELKEE